MTSAELEEVFKALNVKIDKDGWAAFPEGSFGTLHIAKDGASLALTRLEAIRVLGELLVARTPKKEQYFARREDVLAVAFDPGSTQTSRRAGF